MDPIAGLLDGPRARRAFLLRCSLDPPWALHIRDEAPLSLVAMLRGRACFVLDGHEPEWLGHGDVAIPQAIIHPGQRYFARTEQTAPGWYRAQRDPVVGQAVRLLQESPAEAWSSSPSGG
jgi:Cupin